MSFFKWCGKHRNELAIGLTALAGLGITGTLAYNYFNSPDNSDNITASILEKQLSRDNYSPSSSWDSIRNLYFDETQGITGIEDTVFDSNNAFNIEYSLNESSAQEDVPEPYIHTVQRGETLWKIARDYISDNELDLSIQDLVNDIAYDNNITNPDLINIGQELRIDVSDLSSIDYSPEQTTYTEIPFIESNSNPDNVWIDDGGSARYNVVGRELNENRTDLGCLVRDILDVTNSNYNENMRSLFGPYIEQVEAVEEQVQVIEPVTEYVQPIIETTESVIETQEPIFTQPDNFLLDYNSTKIESEMQFMPEIIRLPELDSHLEQLIQSGYFAQERLVETIEPVIETQEQFIETYVDERLDSINLLGDIKTQINGRLDYVNGFIDYLDRYGDLYRNAEFNSIIDHISQHNDLIENATGLYEILRIEPDNEMADSLFSELTKVNYGRDFDYRAIADSLINVPRQDRLPVTEYVQPTTETTEQTYTPLENLVLDYPFTKIESEMQFMPEIIRLPELDSEIQQLRQDYFAQQILPVVENDSLFTQDFATFEDIYEMQEQPQVIISSEIRPDYLTQFGIIPSDSSGIITQGLAYADLQRSDDYQQIEFAGSSQTRTGIDHIVSGAETRIEEPFDFNTFNSSSSERQNFYNSGLDVISIYQTGQNDISFNVNPFVDGFQINNYSIILGDSDMNELARISNQNGISNFNISDFGYNLEQGKDYLLFVKGALEDSESGFVMGSYDSGTDITLEWFKLKHYSGESIRLDE